jgi:two-component system OmpR family sensor kinase
MRQWSLSRWRLRTKLLVALIGLLTATTVAIGALTVVSLNSYLVRQLDEQLATATGRSQSALDSDDDDARRPSRPVVPRGAGGLVAPGQASGTLAVITVDGQVRRAVVLDDNGRPETISNDSVSDLAGIDDFDDFGTVTLDDGLGDYRVVATPTRDGAVLVTGLPLEPLRETLRQATLIVVLISIAGLLAAAVAGAVIINVALRPLRRVAATATSVADLPLDTGEVALAVRVPEEDTDPHTEVGQVGAALNHLLAADALRARHESETRVRNFVADASHELRTPLASIRGYSELTRRADVDLPPDIVHALGRIESESIRMTSLVEDLLLLARLDAGRPIEFTEVDLSALLVAAVSDAHVAAPDHQWDLHLPEDPVGVKGDGDRLAQVVANLLTNARVHTPTGTRIRISLNIDDHAAILQVQDDGPGIPAHLVPEVFGRFSRGDSSRSRAAGSTGLGLAIAAAVVGAHGGAINVTSRPGKTAFTVRLPMTAQPTPPTPPI